MKGRPAASIPTFTSAGMVQALPASVVDAIEKGQKIEAIRLMREQTGLGLKESKDAIDKYQSVRPRPDGLSPGQVGDTKSGIWWVVGLVLLCVVGYMVLRRLA